MDMNIVIPVFDEESALRYGIERTVEFLNETELAGKYRITIADNGSTDMTGKIAEVLCKEYENVDYFKTSQQGGGLAFRMAVKRNRSDVIGYMDVNLATNIWHLKQVYQMFLEKKAQIVVGSRLLPESRVYNRSLLREITSRSLNRILKLMLHVQFTDAMCGFKFYERRTAEKLIEMCSDNRGGFYCAEMMIRAEWAGIPIKEIAVRWRDDSNSKVNIVKLSVSYMSEIIKLFREERGRKVSKTE